MIAPARGVRRYGTPAESAAAACRGLPQELSERMSEW